MLKNAHVLVVDDEQNGRRMLEIYLKKLGCKVSSAQNGEEALTVVNNTSIDLIISDLNMPKLDGIGLLMALRQAGHQLPIIIVTAYGSIEHAVNAMKNGAFDFICRPYNIDQIELVINKALDAFRLKQENDFLKDQLENSSWGNLVGESQSMQSIYHLIKQVAPTTANVLILGETGTGKELVARAIHNHSGRTGLFVPINCAALSASIAESELFGHVRGAFTGADKDRVGKFEFAQHGTLFLDEITEMNMDLQAKLLRVLQESTFERLGDNRSINLDVRIIAASNRDLQQAMSEGYLRKDIYYRLNVFSINLPALRDRKEDILLLAKAFIQKYKSKIGHNADLSLSPSAVDLLLSYNWLGNVRELENIIERAVILAQHGIIDGEHLPHEIRASKPSSFKSSSYEAINLDSKVSEYEIEMLTKALESTQGNKAKAARLLNITERSIWHKLKKYNLLE